MTAHYTHSINSPSPVGSLYL